MFRRLGMFLRSLNPFTWVMAFARRISGQWVGYTISASNFNPWTLRSILQSYGVEVAGLRRLMGSITFEVPKSQAVTVQQVLAHYGLTYTGGVPMDPSMTGGGLPGMPGTPGGVGNGITIYNYPSVTGGGMGTPPAPRSPYR